MKKDIDKDFLNEITFEPLSKDNWEQFVQLFGEKGAADNCWCQYYRLNKAEYEEGKVDGKNKETMRRLVHNGTFTGILALYQNHAIAWCAFSPREQYVKLEKSRTHKRIDDKPVWSIPCFFIDRNFRRQGVTTELLKAVIKYAKKNDIKILEAYPAIPARDKLPDSSAWIGFYKTFENAGFKIVDQSNPNRPTVRYYTEKEEM